VAKRLNKLLWLGPGHSLGGFDCRREELNRFLMRFALVNQQTGAARTYVTVSGQVVVGYDSLAVGEVACDDAPERLKKGLARYPVPIMLLARQALITAWQRHGVAAGLLKDAMRRTVQAADIAGIQAFAVHAIDETTRRFYEHFDFIPSPIDLLHLFLPIKDIRRTPVG
jgi:GNAT superfamily N-acetyltransferase